jgi:hypothetical protein
MSRMIAAVDSCGQAKWRLPDSANHGTNDEGAAAVGHGPR